MDISMRSGEVILGAHNLGIRNRDMINVQHGAALKKACNEFEAIFIESMIKAMRKTVPGDGLFDGGFGEEVFQESFDQEIAGQIARCRGLGVADALYNQLNAKRVSPAG